MFRVEFQSSLNLENAQSLESLCKILFDINEYLNGFIYCVKLCLVLTNTRTVSLCEIRFGCDECLKLFYSVRFCLVVTNTRNLKALLFH